MRIIVQFLLFILLFSFVNIYAQEKHSIFESDGLKIVQLGDGVYQHITYLQTESFGKVACNGMIVVNKCEALILDSPSDDSSSIELIDFIEKEFQANIKGVVATHFHDDCLGGFGAFRSKGIPTYSTAFTKKLAMAEGNLLPEFTFENDTTFRVGAKPVNCKFIGEGHTRDNIVCYFPHAKVLFGGCLVKELDATKGYLGDANLTQWPKTVAKVKTVFPRTKVVIPGHGNAGNQTLLDYTIQLFSSEN